MISAPDRKRAMELIEEARAAGARLAPACRVLGITARTYQRWCGGAEGVRVDGRPLAERPVPAHALTQPEIDSVLQLCHEHPDQPPAQIIAELLDAEGRYIASEASFYRVLRARGEQRHRGRAQPPRRQSRPGSYRADGPCQVWCWDCVRHEALFDRVTVRDRHGSAVAAAGCKLRTARTGERRQGREQS